MVFLLHVQYLPVWAKGLMITVQNFVISWYDGATLVFIKVTQNHLMV